MNREEVRVLILQLRQEHASDRDGGYALVAALKQTHESLDPQSAPLFVEILVDIVRVQEPEIAAVALETLVQMGAIEAVASVAGELIRTIRDEGRKDYLVLGLLRLGQGQIAALIFEHIRSSLADPRPLTVPIIAELCRSDRNAGLDISCEYFERALAGGQSDSVEGSIAAFVRNFVAIDERLLPELVRMVRVRMPQTGQWLAKRVADYLSKPWMVEELGGERCASIRAKITAAEHALN